MTSTLSGSDAAVRPEPRVSRRHVASAVRGLWRGRATDAAWVRPSFLGLLVLAALLDLWDLAASGWANAFYSAAVQAGAEQLGGVPLRLVRRRQLDHGRQAAGLALGDGSLGADLRAQRLEHPAARGADGRRDRGARVPDRAAPLRAGRGADRGCRDRPHACRGADVPVRQPGRAARAAGHARDVPHAPGHRGRACALDPLGRRRHRLRVPDEAAAGVPGRPRARRRLPPRRAPPDRRAPRAPRRGARHAARLRRLVGRDRRARAREHAAVHRRLPDERLPRAHLRLQRLRPAHGPGDRVASPVAAGARRPAACGARPGCSGCSAASSATQISWLLPAALGMLVVGVVVTWRRPRVDAARATVLLLGGTLLVTGLAFSLGAGIIHPYYSVALAPAIGGLVGIGAAMLWAARGAWWARIVSGLIVLASTVWAVVLLSAATTFLPWLTLVVGVAGLLGAAALVVGPADRGAHADRDRRVAGRRARRSRRVRREHHADAAHRIAADRGARRVARLGDRSALRRDGLRASLRWAGRVHPARVRRADRVHTAAGRLRRDRLRPADSAGAVASPAACSAGARR